MNPENESIEHIERGLIGLLVRNPPTINSAISLRDEHFVGALHQRLFRAMLESIKARAVASWDEDLLAAEVARIDKMQPEAAGHLRRQIYELTMASPAPSMVEGYVAQIIEANRVRKLRHSLSQALTGNHDSNEILRIAGEAVTAAASDTSGRMVERADHFVGQFLDRLKRQRAGEETDRIMTYLSQVDDRLMGLEPGDVLVLAGRPGTGKTVMAMNIAYGNALAGIPAEFVSLEMSGTSLIQRLASGVAEVDSRLIRSPALLTDADMRKIENASTDVLMKLPLYISEKANQTTLDIAAHARECVRTKGVRLLVIDYLQLITPNSTRRHEKRETEVSEMSRHIKLLAKELNIPVILLSQMNREGDSTNERPTLKALRESGAIEQDADFVQFLWKRADETAGDGIVEVITEKARHVQTGTDLVRAEFKYFRFRDADETEREDYRRKAGMAARASKTKISAML